jgi:hypothetical protein
MPVEFGLNLRDFPDDSGSDTLDSVFPEAVEAFAPAVARLAGR